MGASNGLLLPCLYSSLLPGSYQAPTSALLLLLPCPCPALAPGSESMNKLLTQGCGEMSIRERAAGLPSGGEQQNRQQQQPRPTLEVPYLLLDVREPETYAQVHKYGYKMGVKWKYIWLTESDL